MCPADCRTLLRKAQAGEATALDRLSRETLPFIESEVRKWPPPGQRYESYSDRDIEVWQRVQEKLGQFDGAATAHDDVHAWAMFCTWVRSVVRTTMLNGERGNSPMPLPLGTPGGDSTEQRGVPEPADPGPGASENLREDERTRMIREVVDRLPDPGRSVVQLCYFEGLSLHQVADQLGLGYDQVRTCHRASISRLERELGDQL